MIKSAIFFLCVTFFFSCQDKSINSIEELSLYLDNDDNSLKKHSYNKGISTSVTYYPKDLIIFNDLSKITYKSLDSARNQLADYQYFKLSLSRSNEEIINSFAVDPNKFSSAVNYLSFGIAKDIKLYLNGVEYSIEDISYNRNFGSSNKSEILLVFKTGKLPRSGELEITFSDSFFNSGYHTYEFETERILTIPTLQI